MTAGSMEIGSAHVSIYPKFTDGFKKAITGQYSDLEQEIKDRGKPAGNAFTTALGGAIATGVKVVGTAGAAILGVALATGFGRLSAIDDAKQKLLGLKMPAETVDQVMTNALASVKGTAFGLGDAATVAATAVAAGVKPGQDLERTLKLVADAAFIGGTSMGDMGAIFNKVAATGKVNGEVLAQLGERGIPILAFLADHLGVTSEEVVKLASKGKISFADFQAAMEGGLGGAAQKSGSTFKGVVDNIMASLGRMGAALLGGIFPKLKDGLAGLLEQMQAWEPIAKQVGSALGDIFTWISNNMGTIGAFATVIGVLAGAFLTLTIHTTAMAAGGYAKWILSAMKATQLWSIAQGALNIIMAANPVGIVITAVAALVALIIYLWNTNEGFRNAMIAAWEAIKGALAGVVGWFTGVLWPGIQSAWDGIVAGAQALGGWLAGVWAAIVADISAAVGVITGLLSSAAKSATSAWGGFLGFFQQLWNSIAPIVTVPLQLIKTAFTAFWETLKVIVSAAFLIIVALFTGNFGQIGSIVQAAWSRIVAIFGAAWDSIVSKIGAAWERAKQIVNTALGIVSNALSRAWQSVVAATVGAWESVKSAISNGITVGVRFVSELPGRAVRALASLGSSLAGVMSSAWNRAKTAITTGISNAITLVTTLPQRARAALSNIGSVLLNAGRQLVQGLMNGIREMAWRVAEAAKNVVGSAIDAAKRTLGIASPSRVFHEMGEQTGEGYGGGIDDSEDRVRRAGSGLAAAAADGASGAAAAGGTSGAGAGLPPRGGMTILGPLVEVAQMVVRTDDDIRKVSQQLQSDIDARARAAGVPVLVGGAA